MSSSFHHITVLADEAVRLLAPRAGGLYCDATVGGGGHAERILAQSAPDGRVIGIDRDPSALAAARARLAPFGDRVTLVHGSFGDAKQILADLGALPVDGFLLDLGISSPQVDVAERGFSFQRSGPLDMRMDPTRGETCGELLQRISPGELARIIRRYGEDPFASKIARAIKEAIAADEVHDTVELAAVIAASLPTRERMQRKTDPATRTFQALRIVVNDELGAIERFLADFPDCVRVGGRVVIIAFHSLEDHLVKNRLRDLSRHPGLPVDIARGMGIRPDPEMDLLTRKPITPTDEETAANPRARSAKLRAAREALTVSRMVIARLRRQNAVVQVSLVVGVVVLAALGHVHLHLQVIQSGYAIAHETRLHHDLEDQNQKLRLELAMRRDPSVIERRGRDELKMSQPDPASIHVLHAAAPTLDEPSLPLPLSVPVAAPPPSLGADSVAAPGAHAPASEARR